MVFVSFRKPPCKARREYIEMDVGGQRWLVPLTKPTQIDRSRLQVRQDVSVLRLDVALNATELFNFGSKNDPSLNVDVGWKRLSIDDV